MANPSQLIEQAVLEVPQGPLDRNQEKTRLALFNRDGTPIDVNALVGAVRDQQETIELLEARIDELERV